MTRSRRILGLFGAAVCSIALVAAGCGGSDDGGTTPTTQSGSGGGGRDGNDVLPFQRELNTLGCDAGPLDGKLGPDTLGAVRRFQAAAGLTVDGIVGAKTRDALTTAATVGNPRCPSTPAPPAPPKPSGTPPCTQGAIEPVVVASLLAGEQLVKLNQFNCAITWAVSTPTVKSASDPNGVAVTVLLRWNGTAWQVVDRGVYCDAGSVPKAIVQQSCNAN